MTDPATYTPPAIWVWNKENGGRFANINRPVAGPTHDKELPVGRHPLQLYSLATPNGVKVTVLLEELLALGHTGAEYDAWLIRIHEGHQFGSGFVQVNPNSKIPALMDRSGPAPIRVFESGAILLYLAEKFGAFLPTEPAQRAECLSWLFWQMGSTSTASVCTRPCGSKRTSASGWSSCAVTSPGRRWQTRECSSTPPARWNSISRHHGATAPRTW